MEEKVPTTWELFKSASNEDLDPLVDYIKNASVTEWLTVSNLYKNNFPNHSAYISEIYDEICKFGGNTFANLFRGGNGPDYSEVLQDAAGKIGVKNARNLSILEMEQGMIELLLRKAIQDASHSEREEIKEKLYEAGMSEKDYSSFLSGAVLSGLIAAVVYRAVMSQVAVVAANAVARQILGHGIRVGAGFAMGRMGSVLLGPVGLALAGAWTALDMAGPAYRVTIPCAIHIAMLRQKWLSVQAAQHIRDAFSE